MTAVQPERSIIARTSSIAVASVAQSAIAFVATAYVSRLLGPSGRGVYYLPILTATTALAFCKLGVDQANVFLLASRSVPMRALSAQNTLVALAMGSLGLMITLYLPSVSPSMYAAAPMHLLFIAGLLIPLGIHTQLSAGLLSLAGRPALQYRAGALGALAQITTLTALLMHGTVTPAGALGAVLCAAATTWAMTAAWLRRTTPLSPVLDLSLLRETLRHALPLHASSLLLLLHLRLDMFMVSFWRGPRALGLYSLSVTLAETLMLATESIALALLAEQVTGTVRDAALRSLDGVRAMLAIGLVLSAGWMVFGRVVIRVAFGADYLQAYGPLVALLPGIMMLALQRMCSAPALRVGRPSFFVAISGASLACNAALNTVWIPRWGLYGASIASSVSYALSSVLFLGWTARSAGVPLHRIFVPRRADWLLVRTGLSTAATRIGLRGSRGAPSGLPQNDESNSGDGGAAQN